MSKMLNLSPRVIVVWFQNARQKARKNYENNPPSGLQDEEARYNRTPGLNYQCKRCNTVFQRYYELIRHQKTQCYKDEAHHPTVSNPGSNPDDSNSSYTSPPMPDAIPPPPRQEPPKPSEKEMPSSKPPQHAPPSLPVPVSAPPHQPLKMDTIPQPPPQPVVIKPEPDVKDDLEEEQQKEKKSMYQCEKCPAKFPRFDLWKEHQTIHLMNPSLFSPFPPESAFAMLQNVAAQPGMPDFSRPSSQPPLPVTSTATTSSKKEATENPMMYPGMDPFALQMQQLQQRVSSHSSSPSSTSSSMDHNPLKRKAEEEVFTMDAQGQKRMRTTILPEQLDYLYQQYQTDCNPSRKQIEQIAGAVGLKKRVVQVWYQNTRARERKGQFRAHMQIIHKRCPVCRALFRAKSALESHLASKHPERMAKGDINIDALPDEPLESLGSPSSASPGIPTSSSMPMPPGLDMARLLNNPYNMPSPFIPMVPPPAPHSNSSDQLQLSMKKMYEDSLKKYLDDLSSSGPAGLQHPPMPPVPHFSPPKQEVRQTNKSPAVSSSSGAEEGGSGTGEEAPLDLSKPLPRVDDSLNMSTDSARRMSMDDSISETYSESAESHNDDGIILTDYYPSSPNTNKASPAPNSLTSPAAGHPGQQVGGGGSGAQMPHKRYRTQMNSLQIKVMKAMFVDYKTPTMAECELLGREIGLAKRVVQVWFQNARAKEKKAKLNYANSYNMEVDFYRPPEECKVCNFTYSHKYTIQDHIFTKNHIARLRSTMMAQGDSGTESSYPDFKDPIVVRSVSGGDPGTADSMPSSVSSSGGAVKPWSDGAGSGAGDPSVVSHPHLAQLHAMGLQAMASGRQTTRPSN